MMNFIFDCDDVLLDWIGGFKTFMLNTHGIVPATPEPDSWDMNHWVGQPALPLIKEFNESEAFGRLSPLPGAVDAVRSIKGGVAVVSSCGVSGGPVEFRRRENLISQFGPRFWKIVCIPLGSEKSAVLDKFEPSVWVEDNYKHALAGVFAGHDTWIIRRPHNQKLEAESHNLIKWVDSVQEVVSHYM